MTFLLIFAVIFRAGPTDNNLLTAIDHDDGRAGDQFNVSIPLRDQARNFNFMEPLYLGGLPTVKLAKWRDKLNTARGIQVSCEKGC